MHAPTAPACDDQSVRSFELKSADVSLVRVRAFVSQKRERVGAEGIGVRKSPRAGERSIAARAVKLYQKGFHIIVYQKPFHVRLTKACSYVDLILIIFLS